jgi:hypothetical protein
MIINDKVQALGVVVAPQLPTYVFHGATGSTARPADAGVVVWVGTATPANANTSTDFWIDTT